MIFRSQELKMEAQWGGRCYLLIIGVFLRVLVFRARGP